jgi:hypothetical protein
MPRVETGSLKRNTHSNPIDNHSDEYFFLGVIQINAEHHYAAFSLVPHASRNNC